MIILFVVYDSLTEEIGLKSNIFGLLSYLLFCYMYVIMMYRSYGFMPFATAVKITHKERKMKNEF